MTISTLVCIDSYYYIAVFATLLFIVKLAFFIIAGGADTEVFADFNTETETDTSFNFISVQSLLAFLMGFGWMGYAALKQFKMGEISSIIVSLITGVIFMLLSSGLMFMLKKLEKNVKKDITSAINKVGKAYTKFEPHSTGQIEIDINDQLMVIDAINDTDTEINSFEGIRVVKAENNKLYIEKL